MRVVKSQLCQYVHVVWQQGGVADASPQCRAVGAIVAPRCCGGGYGLNAKLGQSVREDRGRFAHELMI